MKKKYGKKMTCLSSIWRVFGEYCTCVFGKVSLSVFGGYWMFVFGKVSLSVLWQVLGEY